MKMEQNIVNIPLEDIIPNRFQPRLSFEENGLKELSESIKQHGIIQPLVLRRLGNKYEIIAGERRYKAATMAGLQTVPAVISNIDDNQSAEVALVENIQRRNLTPIEEAKSYQNLLDRGYLTQEQLAEKMGVSQSSIANKLRLLKLDDAVQEALLNEKISERHARSLLAIPMNEQQQWLKKILDNRMTVRQLDIEIKKYKDEYGTDDSDIPLVSLTPNIDEIRANAQDINVIMPADTLNEMEETMMNNAISEGEPTLPNEIKTERMPNKFFNFLEDEAANMVVDEPLVQPISSSSPFDNLETLEIAEELPVEVDETPVSNANPFSFNGNESVNTIEEKVEMAPEEEFVDPINFIERLDPSFEEKKLESSGLDLKTAINMVRTKIGQMNDVGFILDTEEIDLSDEYQITIKIKK